VLKKRIFSALLVIPLVIFLVWQGGLLFFALIFLISHLALRELYELLQVSIKRLRLAGLTGNALLLPIMFLFGIEAFFLALIVFFLSLFTLYWLSYPAGDFPKLTAVLFGKLYITTMLSLIFVIRTMPVGFNLVVMLLLAVWATEAGAYFFGLTFGRRRLAPRVSPKKSVEGALGGLIAALFVLWLIAPYLGFSRLSGVSLGFILSLSGQVGDLAESALKRWAQAKDSGSFLPGHGGVLDRLDSLLFALPAAYIWATFFH